jgi:transposase-like protein
MSHTKARQTEQPAVSSAIPDPEVVVKPKRRQFTADYKRHILQEAGACTQPGEIGALLRRKGLHSSHLTTGRHQHQQDELEGLAPAKRGRKADPQAVKTANVCLFMNMILVIAVQVGIYRVGWLMPNVSASNASGRATRLACDA